MKRGKIVAVALCIIATPFILIEGIVKRKGFRKLVRMTWWMMWVRVERMGKK